MSMAGHPQLTGDEEQSLLQAYDALYQLRNSQVPAVRGGVRAALAELAQVLNGQGLRYDLYGPDLD